MTCDATCQKIVCGDGKREGTKEQCDDGNKTSLDGCDSSCKFEQDHRANSVAIASTTDAFCPNNALGKLALTSTAIGQLNPTLETSVLSGSTTIEFKFLGLNDLSGTAQDGGLSLGALTGTVVPAPSGVTYDGGADLDWWYTTSPSVIDSSRNPTSTVGAQINAKLLTTPVRGTVNLTVTLAGANAVLHMTNTSIQANIGGVSAPKESAGQTPGHLAAENLDPTLQSFASMNNGLLCGNISAASLKSVPIPTLLTTGLTKCLNGLAAEFTSTNTLLDALVVGCTAAFKIGVINPTQPDQHDPSVPAAGSGANYTLTTTGNSVTGCKDSAGNVADFDTCLNAAAYSAYFDFTSDRVIAK